MAYDFSTLSPHDFELLTQDLLQREYGYRLEGFKSGRDGGVDLRRSEEGKLGLVVQCKHYSKSTYAQLRRTLRESELPKIQRLAPKRYVLVTSRPLSVAEKGDLTALLSPHCRSPEDILGAEDVNALLRAHPDVEKAHFKLWVASTAVLETILHNDLFSRRHLEAEEIKTRLSLFVPTEAVTRAQEALVQHGFCLLSGIPGIGKTTTAEMLVALLLDQDWDCVFVRSNAAEAMRAYDKERRQVFYYDDFLGKTSLTEKLGKNEDHELTKLIKTCSRKPNSKRLILTTRNYLLSQAMEQHEVLSDADFRVGTCVVELSDYTPLVRAQILVNHLWFYGVKETWCRKLVKSGAARNIVDHEHYNPRLVEAVALRTVKESANIHAFPKNAVALLDDPADLWRHAYQNQLSDAARELLVSFASLGDGCYLAALRKAYQELTSKGEDDLGVEAEFLRALRELEGTFVNIDASPVGQTVSYHNPSVKDFMDGLFTSTEAYGRRVVKFAVFYNQVGYAARHLLHANSDADAEVERLVAQRLAEVHLSRSAVPERIAGQAWKDSPVKPAQRLLAWRRSYWDSTREHLKSALAELGAQYLSSGVYYEDDAEDLADLARWAEAPQESGGIGCEFDASKLEGWLWGNLRSTDDFRAMDWWISEWDDASLKEVARSKLQGLFVDFAESQLDELSDGSRSSSDIEEGIGAIKDLAAEIGVEELEIDFDDAEAARDRALEEEDREADMRQEEWQLRRHEEAESDAAVDDVLDSLI